MSSHPPHAYRNNGHGVCTVCGLGPPSCFKLQQTNAQEVPTPPTSGCGGPPDDPWLLKRHAGVAEIVPVAEYIDRLKPGRYIIIFGRTGDGDVWHWNGSMFSDNDGNSKNLYRGQGWCDGILARVDEIVALRADNERLTQQNETNEKRVVRLVERNDGLKEQVEALQRFKDFVHRRLDEAGVPTHPDGPHSKEGCRVGDRLDVIQAERDQERAARVAAEAQRDALVTVNETLTQRLHKMREGKAEADRFAVNTEGWMNGPDSNGNGDKRSKA